MGRIYPSSPASFLPVTKGFGLRQWDSGMSHLEYLALEGLMPWLDSFFIRAPGVAPSRVDGRFPAWNPSLPVGRDVYSIGQT